MEREAVPQIRTGVKTDEKPPFWAGVRHGERDGRGMDRKRPAVTLKDIAQRTGYSINTVSRALRGKEDIAEETRENIQRIAAEMGHVSNTLAASLRLGYTKTIAVILGDISNPHFAVMMKEAEAHAREYGYTSILFNTNEEEEQELEAIRTALNKNVDGIIICPSQRSAAGIQYLKKTGVPFVLIGRHEADCSYVVCNDELGGYQATGALLAAGHRNILLLHGAMYISSARERLAGYRRAFAEAHIPVDERLIREVPVTASGCEVILRQLEREGLHFTAVFAFSDMLAWEAWNCMRKRGRRVPEDCSVVGFDHIQSRLSLPFSLTSVSSYKGRMSTEAVEILVRQMNGRTEREQIIIDTRLAEGETVAPPEGSGESKQDMGKHAAMPVELL